MNLALVRLVLPRWSLSTGHCVPDCSMNSYHVSSRLDNTTYRVSWISAYAYSRPCSSALSIISKMNSSWRRQSNNLNKVNTGEKNLA
ncbi:hypothetical protein BDP27DRAFT_417287 [Rhodocollybia butyracea]|uniref:Secreted protein n=1 Tax=Rhodocollybia butyracea TaxID=206335 RepID=A0A9P5TZ62_9AGAR|nr:hypothetical protein BDP27DRAFT_417287 [Rhodocollybia butyracea]